MDENNKTKLQKPEGLHPQFSRVWDEYGDALQAISNLYVSLAEHHDVEAWKIVNAFISVASQTCCGMMQSAEKTTPC